MVMVMVVLLRGRDSNAGAGPLGQSRRARYARLPGPAIAYSRLGTGRTPSAMPSSSNFPASHLRGSELGLIAQSYRALSSPPLGRGAPQPPRCVGFRTTMSIAAFWTSPTQQKAHALH